ncbi:FMN-binding protein [Pseudoflavonifractor phocaeensis]|uniref:FMN-binding protein n=1 Tax=Pseudoflavonifractor phocaeensis TaxID=1870988 RepID=UPI0025A3F629|nr:FMN-binding protein [Pseudoflavonifractor phocaeensis]MDM8238040.1 FMN-binding protein [Pseudoflavonifractor phocaeensis]
MSNWNKIFKPIVVLVIICIVVTGALAATNGVTAPIIEEAKVAAENAARTELLPEAEGAFTPVENVEVENVSAVYVADNGAGTIITSSAKGYGGDVVVMTAFNPDGTIKQIKVTEQAETKGIGSKVVDTPSYWENYQGLDASQPLVLNEDVDAVTSATISSTALINAVNSAIEAYNAIP